MPPPDRRLGEESRRSHHLPQDPPRIRMFRLGCKERGRGGFRYQKPFTASAHASHCQPPAKPTAVRKPWASAALACFHNRICCCSTYPEWELSPHSPGRYVLTGSGVSDRLRLPGKVLSSQYLPPLLFQYAARNSDKEEATIGQSSRG